ncbi:LUD domain-containing protein [Flavihumibacter sp. CACIAM 22H1]|uniref:LutC/YkgG family protein n=1 Tax=Flavihumibacter sp. CACIAM 22H1 TaxID=1812911 RepID=UPI0007A8B112|nr:LUD domain-containing protein [Flavihumibacter sp. CACIAM 22H1]KYP14802.1 MAG: lactate utilization protein B/C [Flavihumibacter sp. CACIAM 22H1]
MKASTAKESILKKIRKALSESTPLPFPSSEGNQSVYQPPPEDLDLLFAEQFGKLQGKFVFCLNQQELQAQLELLAQQQGYTKIYCRESSFRAAFSTGSLKTALLEDSSPEALKNCDAAITACECLVARTGTIVLSSAEESGRTSSVYAPVHICIATTSQLVYDIKDGLKLLKEKYGNRLPSFISFASGPSRTADIEKTLVVGVHGPKEVYLFLVDNS